MEGIDYNYIYCTNNKTIKEYLFYTNDKLNVLEIHEFNDNNVKTYINKKVLYLNYQTYYENEITICFDKYKDDLLKTKDIIKQHDEFIKNISKLLGPITYNHRLKYGWVVNKNFKINIYKFKPIVCCIKENEKEFTLSIEELSEYLNKFNINELYINMNKLNLNEKKDSIKKDSIKKEKRKLDDCDEQPQDYKKTNTDFLFIKYPKHIRLEYQTCKSCNKEEMEFERRVFELNLNE